MVRTADCQTNRFAKAALRNGSALMNQYVAPPEPTNARTVVRVNASAASRGSDQSLLKAREVGIMRSVRDMRFSIGCTILYAQGSESVFSVFSRDPNARRLGSPRLLIEIFIDVLFCCVESHSMVSLGSRQQCLSGWGCWCDVRCTVWDRVAVAKGLGVLALGRSPEGTGGLAL